MLQFSQDNPQNNFLNFLTTKNIFIPWNIFEIDIRGMFLEYSENITSRLLEFVKRWTFVIIKSYTLNAKNNFSIENFLKNLFI